MKLIGSKQEQEFRKELAASNIIVAQGEKERAILKVLRSYFGKIQTAYILNWTPEQFEDIYTILIDLDKIAKIEISKDHHLEITSIETYELKNFQRDKRDRCTVPFF